MYFAYDEAGHLLGEYDATGELIQETVWLEDIPVATLRPDGASGIDVYYVHTDHLNTPRRITDPADDEIIWRWDSEPYGATASDEDPDEDESDFVYNLRFPGQFFDNETGLHHNYFRDYDPRAGRYVESDPIGLAAGLNTYVYVSSNPLLGIDPYGLFDLRDLYSPDDPGLVIGETIAASVAWSVGKITGDELLCNVAAEDLAVNQQRNVDAFLVLMGGKGGRGARGLKPGAGKVAYHTNQQFKRWFHKEYKPDVKATSRDRHNPDVGLDDAYKQWLGEGSPSVK